MGGRKSPDFQEYTRQCVQALLVARKHAKQVKNLMEIMTYHSSYPAFRYCVQLYVAVLLSVCVCCVNTMVLIESWLGVLVLTL